MADLAIFKWHARSRNYELEKRRVCCKAEEVAEHPLRELTVTVADAKGKKLAGPASQKSEIKSSAQIIDPLSRTFDGPDPLSMFAAESAVTSSRQRTVATVNTPVEKPAGSVDDVTFEPWAIRRAGILNRYTTSEKLSIVTILAPSSSSEKRDVPGGAVSEKVKNRLEQLDDLEEGSVQETLNLSQQEYIHRIEELNQSLIQAWNEDQRVKSLKIAIQCSKLLADVSVIQFYPSKFVLITDILDTFGRLVFDRIAEKAIIGNKGGFAGQRLQPGTFTPDQVPESAKETCRNWFYKIASIRELLPRLYVEAAILRCYSFLATDQYSRALSRLALMTRGIGDPLVASFARCYLCRVGVLTAPKISEHFTRCYEDLLSTFTEQVGGDSVQNVLAVQRIDMSRYVVLYAPALDWILQCIAHKADEGLLDAILKRCKTMPVGGAMLLNSVISSFRPAYVTARSVELARMIREMEDTGFPRHLLYRSLGLCVVVANPPDDQRLALLNEVWKAITKMKSPDEYISCVDVWIEYVLKCFGRNELNTVLADILKHMTPDHAFEDHYSELQSILTKIVLLRSTDFAVLFSHDKFMPFIDLFQKESVKVSVCRSIMEAYVREPREPTSDPVVIHSLMSVCRTLHDTVDAMSVDDDVIAFGSLINNGLIRGVSFGNNLEQQLAFYVECRAAFCNIDPVMQFLIRSVNRVAADLHRGATQATGGHTRRTAAFARACAAFAFITIPSLNGVFHRLSLYLESGQIALVNQCLSQADAFFRAAVELIPSVPRLLVMDGKVRQTEPLVVDFVNNFVAALVVVPDCPDQGTLYLIRGLLNVVQDFAWEQTGDSRHLIYCNVLGLMSAVVQDSLPYHIPLIDSNDALYGGDPQFIADVDQICTTLLHEIIKRIHELDGQPPRKFALTHELFARLVAYADVDNNEQVLNTAVWCCTILSKLQSVDSKLYSSTVEHILLKSRKTGGSGFKRLANELHVRKS